MKRAQRARRRAPAQMEKWWARPLAHYKRKPTPLRSNEQSTQSTVRHSALSLVTGPAVSRPNRPSSSTLLVPLSVALSLLSCLLCHGSGESPQPAILSDSLDGSPVVETGEGESVRPSWRGADMIYSQRLRGSAAGYPTCHIVENLSTCSSLMPTLWTDRVSFGGGGRRRRGRGAV